MFAAALAEHPHVEPWGGRQTLRRTERSLIGVEIGSRLARRIEVRDDSLLDASRRRVGEHVSHSVGPEVRGIRDQRRQPTTVLDRDDIVRGAVHYHVGTWSSLSAEVRDRVADTAAWCCNRAFTLTPCRSRRS